jgi:hypothetical protein
VGDRPYHRPTETTSTQSWAPRQAHGQRIIVTTPGYCPGIAACAAQQVSHRIRLKCIECRGGNGKVSANDHDDRFSQHATVAALAKASCALALEMARSRVPVAEAMDLCILADPHPTSSTRSPGWRCARSISSSRIGAPDFSIPSTRESHFSATSLFHSAQLLPNPDHSWVSRYAEARRA